MGRHAQSAWIIRVFAFVLGAASPVLAHAAATALGVALDAGASCSNARINVELTTDGNNREAWSTTNLAGTVLTGPSEGQSGFPSGTSTGFFPQVLSPSQPANSLIGSYAYVGATPPDANTAEFFVFYNCSTREVIQSCFGPYGTCPQTAQQATPSAAMSIPALGTGALALVALLIAVLGGRAISRRI